MNKRRHMLFLMVFLSLCLLTVPVFAKNKEKQRKEDKTTQITIKQEATETTATTEKSTETEKNSVYFSFAIYKDQDITLKSNTSFTVSSIISFGISSVPKVSIFIDTGCGIPIA